VQSVLSAIASRRDGQPLGRREYPVSTQIEEIDGGLVAAKQTSRDGVHKVTKSRLLSFADFGTGRHEVPRE
jgi:hypothetical protein